LPIVLPLAHGRSPTSLRRPRVPTPSRFLPGPRGDGRRLLSLLGWLHLIREGHRLLGGESPVIASTIVGVVVGSPSRSSPGALSGKIEWRGLALSRLQAHHSALHASLIVGALWGSAPAAVVDQSGAPSAEPLSQRSFSVSSLRQWSALDVQRHRWKPAHRRALPRHRQPLTVFLEPLGGRGPTVTDLRRAEVVTAVAIVVATGPDHLPPHTANRQPCHR
jgi:hypothetical protein